MSTTNRRDFLKITATVSGTALVGPPALGQTTLPGSKNRQVIPFSLMVLRWRVSGQPKHL